MGLLFALGSYLANAPAQDISPTLVSSLTLGDTVYLHRGFRGLMSTRSFEAAGTGAVTVPGNPSRAVREAASVPEITSCPWPFVEPITRHPSAVISFSHSLTNSFIKSRHQKQIGRAGKDETHKLRPQGPGTIPTTTETTKTHNPVCEVERRTASLTHLSELAP
ncbi:hypothetical protein BDP55DRAFT_649963 [Colletotrichum godetiae]|uniref:Uncharacterized protein n=1 Tax=Colletotrichum godetiae TaxID=1209918 RepID=A0AAJ0ATS6_9PEZI|nr:uncharacterized protein BDP55DRAFT_649963 [Colletotrichum godetiae]KAK1690213.1 hypothetical protein BDP55DRAFT_649963 [Colletotrichum godetiae]